MNLLEIFRKRRSVRSFSYSPIPSEVWRDVLEAGRIAATSRNKQARRFITITEPARIRSMVIEAKMQEFLGEASALVVGCATDVASTGADVIISLTQMEMMAVSRGLGTIWLGVFDRDVVAQRINLPAEYKVVLMMAFGYPSTEGNMPEKLPLDELYRENNF